MLPQHPGKRQLSRQDSEDGFTGAENHCPEHRQSSPEELREDQAAGSILGEKEAEGKEEKEGQSRQRRQGRISVEDRSKTLGWHSVPAQATGSALFHSFIPKLCKSYYKT